MSNPLTWYDDSYLIIQEVYRDDADIFAGFLAATSAHCSLKSNVTIAKRAYAEYNATGTFSERYLGVHLKNLHCIVSFGRPATRKCGDFYSALVGNPDAVPVDIWMARAFGHEQVTHPIYARIEEKIKVLAMREELAARDYQAQLWCEVRGDSTSYADLLRQYKLF